MSNDVEELVRDSMRQATGEVRMGPDLAGRLTGQAAGRRRQRRLRARAGLAATAAVAAVAGFLTTSAVTGGRPTAPRIETVGYVLGRVNHALDGLAGRPLVAYVQRSKVEDGRLQANGRFWIYIESPAKRLVLNEILSPDGQVQQARGAVFDTAGPGLTWDTTVVNYQNRTWLTQTAHFPRGGFIEPSCQNPELGLFALGDALRDLVKCGDYVRVARQQVDGVPTIELVPSRAQRTKAGLFPQTVWVDAATYLPVRILDGDQRGTVSELDVRWLPATPANLARLTPRIPAGFRHTSVR